MTYAVLRIQININIWKHESGSKEPKTATKNKKQILTIEKRDIIKMFWSLNGLSSFSLKVSDKKRKNNKTIMLLKKTIVNLKEMFMTWSFFQSSKLNGSSALDIWLNYNAWILNSLENIQYKFILFCVCSYFFHKKIHILAISWAHGKFFLASY